MTPSKKMRVLIVGSGGREHALYAKLQQSPLAAKVYVTPGNAGIPQKNRFIIPANDLHGLRGLAEDYADLVVVGPEAPLVEGFVDMMADRLPRVRVFGPSQAAAKLEGSKIFFKNLCASYRLPTAPFRTAENEHSAWHELQKFIEDWDDLPVIKADGLCAGKGVVLPQTEEEAKDTIKKFFVGRIHGSAGQRVVLEKRLEGEECSLMALCDGKQALILDAARDYKRVRPEPGAPNTGGMGAYSPLPDVPRGGELYRQMGHIIQRLVEAMLKEDKPYHGLMYAGFMLTKTGPSLLEVNCRFGDPETQVLLPRMESDLLPYLVASTKFGGFAAAGLKAPRWLKDSAVSVVLAKGKYPEADTREYWVNGIEEAQSKGAVVYHAGTSINGVGRLVASGGRILNMTGLGPTHAEARRVAYLGMDQIEPNGFQYRKDIAAGV